MAARGELAAILEPRFAERTVAEWLAELDAAGIAAGPILGVAEALAHPQVLARGMVAEVAHPTVGRLRTLGVPVRLSETPGKVRTAPPRHGEHGAELLQELLGLDGAEVERLVAAGAVLSSAAGGDRG